MADSIGGRQRHHEHIGTPTGPQVHLLDPGERESEREGVHHRVRRDAAGDDVGAGELMREREVTAGVFECQGVRLRVRGLRKQEIPGTAGDVLEIDPGVEVRDPAGERVTVIAAGRELTTQPPVDVSLPAPDGENRPAVLARYGQHAGVGVPREQPVIEGGSLEPAGRRPLFIRHFQRR